MRAEKGKRKMIWLAISNIFFHRRMKFINTAMTVDAQLTILDCLGMTPSNPEAFAKIPAGLQPYAVNSKENIDKVIFNDPVGWAEKGGDAVNAFLDAIG